MKDRTDYYTSKNRLIRHDVEHDVFYVWDNSVHAWKHSPGVWHEFYERDGWCDGSFHEYDMDELTAQYFMESTRQYEARKKGHHA